MLGAAAADINEALYETCHTAMLEPGRSYADLAEWCAAVATSADALAKLVSSSTPGDGWAPWDAIELLKPAWRGDGGAETLVRVRNLVMVAMPYINAQNPPEVFVNALARVAPELLALAQVAQVAEAHWSKRVTRGGKAPDRPRRHLMNRLSTTYALLFGRHPTVVVRYTPQEKRAHNPTGASVAWFAGLFALIEARLPLAVPAVEPLLNLAVAARSQTDALPNWLRDAGRQRKSPCPKLRFPRVHN